MSENLNNVIEAEKVSLEGSSLSPFRERMTELLGQVERMDVVDQSTYAKGGDLYKIINNDLKSLNEARLATTEQPRKYTDWVNAEFKKLTDPLKAAGDAVKAKMKKWADDEEARRREEERKAREEAEAAALAEAEKAEAARKEAEAREQAKRDEQKAAQEAGDTAAAEKAAQEAAEAAKEATEHQQQSEQVIDAAANAPQVDTTVRKVRGSYGSTAGMRKVWKCEVIDVLEFLADGPATLASLAANDPKVLAAVESAVKKAAIDFFKTNGKEIPGLNVFEDSQVSVR